MATNNKSDPLAVKILPIDTSSHTLQSRASLEKEVAIHRVVKHQNIIRLFDYTEDASFIYILMEYAAGGELFDKIGKDLENHRGIVTSEGGR